MRMFLAFFVIAVGAALMLAYVPEARKPVLRHTMKVFGIALGVALLLFLMFTSLSTFTWRLF